MKTITLKNLISLFAIATSTLLANYAMAYNFSAVCSSGQTLFYNITSDTEPYTVEVTRERTSSPYYNTAPEGDLEIPETVEHNGITYSVTSIGNSAFSGCSELTSVTIPNSVVSIGQWAFSGCYGLTGELIIPNSVTNLYNNAFSACENISSVIIGDGITSIEQGVFYACSGMTNVSISNSVTTIIRGAFNGCYGLTSVAIPNSVTSIGEYAFGGVKNVEYNGTATGSPWGALTVNGYIDGYLVYADETKTILTGCSTLATDAEIPNSVTSIGEDAFEACKILTEVTIPNSVTSIGDYAFASCVELLSISIPSSVTNIGSSAFSRCSGLEVFSVETDNTIYDSRNNCNAIIETETNSLIFGCKNTIIPNSVTSIGDNAFNGCSGLTSITIPNSVTRIGDYAFSSCSELTSATIPDSVTNIGEFAFDGCRNMETITIGLMVDTINDFAFLSCYNITDINVRALTPPVLGAAAFSDSTYTGAKVWCTCGLTNDYINDSAWGQFADIRNDTTVIFNIAIETADYEMGSVTGEGIFNCEDEVILTAIPNEGYRFVSWNDGNTDNPRTITVVSDSTFVANFEEIPIYTITTLSSNDAYGMVSGSGSYEEGTEAILTATPNQGYCFISWDDDNTENPRTITVTSDSTFVANFSETMHYAIDTTVTKYLTIGDRTFYVAGQYSYTIYSEEGCDTIIDLNLRVLDEPETYGISPNPAKSMISISSEDYISHVEFYTSTGRPVMQMEINAKQAEVNVEGFAPGIYFVRLYGEDGNVPRVQRFVKE